MSKSPKSNVRKCAAVVLCATVYLTVLGACTTMSTTPRPDEFYMRHRAALKLAVQIVVVEFLHRHQAMAEHVATIATALQQELAGHTGDMALFETLLQQKIVHLDLSPSGQLLLSGLAESLVEMARTYIIERGALPHDTLMRFSDMAGWIAESATMHRHP